MSMEMGHKTSGLEIAIIIVILATVGLLMVGFFNEIMVDHKQGCDQYADRTVTQIPVKCWNHFGITGE